MCFSQYSLLLFVATSLILHVTTDILYIKPDDHYSTNNTSTITLSQCVSNSEKCFTSNRQLLFLKGVHILKDDFIIQNIMNFKVIGNHGIIKCTNSSVGIAIINVTKFLMHNIEIIYCRKTYNRIVATFHDIPKLHWRAAMHLHYCESAVVTNVSITVDVGTNGLVVFDAMMESFKNVYVMVIFLPINSSYTESPTNGMLVCLFKSNESIQNVLTIQNFTYRQILFSNYSISGVQNVLYIVIPQLPYKANIAVNLLDIECKNLKNVTVLYYYCYTHLIQSFSLRTGKSKLSMKNINVYNNTGNSLTDLLVLKVINCYSIEMSGRYILFSKSYFYGNTNIHSIITLVISTPCLSQYPVIVRFDQCEISYNHATTIINANKKKNGQKRWTAFFIFRDLNISSNMHTNGTELILLNAAYVKFYYGNITNNIFYRSLIKFNLSILSIIYYLAISKNYVRNILSITDGSYTLLNSHSEITITNNIVHSISTIELLQRAQLEELCCFQFKQHSKNQTYNSTIKNFNIITNNTYTAPVQYVDFGKHFSTCEWISDSNSAFYSYKPSKVFSRVVNAVVKAIDRNDIGIIPSSICKCTNFTNYNCSEHDIGKIFPGQTLTANLIVSRLLHSSNSVTLTVETTHLFPNSCKSIKVVEMAQTHKNTGCNQYNYTVWSDKTECELYLSAEGVPEIFYVTLLPCPVGFLLQSHLQGCHCDPALNCDVISVTTCNLVDGTILRPTNSWISADTVNGSHRYYVSSQCLFDYCLPYSSYLNLSTPDMQCQFNRSGVLCGHCQQGLSAVFGSSQCKECSNIYLLIIIPIAIAGVMLVMMLFVLNLTVINGTINTFIFYVNIVNTNYSTLFPNCHSPICVLLSIFNLDLGIETCFYNNMSNYTKTCLQLAFPLYLIMISSALIMGSRYSSKVQRLTARRGLHVLATLFLLSYTKILSMVCHVLFFYTEITHLPSRHTQLFWSVDTSVELLGVKFTILFIICLLILFVLILFNILLLFTRSLLRFRLVSKFKPLLDPYLSPYKDKRCYWSGLQLLIRALFFALSALDNRVSLLSGIIVAGALLCAQGLLQPFKSQLHNIQELFILLNLSLVYVITSHNYYNNVNNTATQYVILAVITYFIFFIIYTCITTLCGRAMQQINDTFSYYIKGFKLWKKRKIVSFEMSSKIMSSEIPDVTFNYEEFQEPLVGVTD